MKNAKEYLQKVPARFEPDSLSGRKNILPLRELESDSNVRKNEMGEGYL